MNLKNQKLSEMYATFSAVQNGVFFILWPRKVKRDWSGVCFLLFLNEASSKSLWTCGAEINFHKTPVTSSS